MRAVKALFVLLFLSSGAAAQENTDFFQPTELCLSAASDLAERRGCIGKSAEACVEAVTQGTLRMIGGVGRCYSKEEDFWDGRLDAAYKAGLARAQENNTQPAGLEALVPPKADAYREMQEGWSSFRDLQCRFEGNYLVSIVPAVQVCLMRTAGEQALFLEDIQSRF